MKEGGKQKGAKKKKSRWILAAVFVLLLCLGISIYTSIAGRRAASEAHNLTTITLSKTEIANTISVSGQVDSSNVTNIYSLLLNYPVIEVLVEIGDRVEKGDTLARIDTKSLDYDINQAKNNLKNAQKTLETEKQNNQNSIVNAQNALNSATVSLDRQQLAYEKSLADLKEKEKAVAKPFDSYTYDNVITEAKVTLDKKIADLAEAEYKLNSEKYAFDAYTYNNTINDAKIKLDRAIADLEKAINDKEQADIYDSNQSAIDVADAKVTAARNAVNDAQRAYDKALEDLDRAYDKAVEDATKKVDTAKLSLSDAQRAYDKAVTDLQKAKDKAAEDNPVQLSTAQRNVADAEKSLESARLSVTNAQNNLNQAKSKILTGESNVANQQIALDKLLDQFANAEITASERGTITAVNAIEGTNPSGILFTIEDTNQLYVSAKVKEYNLKDLSIGQNVFITTDATDKEIFEGEIIYISPTAVSEAGSTNVEFEIWVAIENPNKNIKIGMNAFLEIIVTSKNDVYAVPLSAIITNENGTFVRSQSGNETIDIPVEIGITTSTSAEISGEGIEDGLIILSAPNVN
jgi:multidrug efflux pump subunit AcrA (membrane-fusion protein)